jgi:hypothetical protein
MIMDPNTALARLRDLAADAVSGAASLNDVAELGELVQDLDAWLTNGAPAANGGGFLPAAWDRATVRAARAATGARQHDDD